MERLYSVNSEKNTKQQLQVNLLTLEMNKREEFCDPVKFHDTTLKVGSVFIQGIALNAGVRYWHGDFAQTFGKPLTKTKKIELLGNCPKLNVYEDKVFVPKETNRSFRCTTNRQGCRMELLLKENQSVWKSHQLLTCYFVAMMQEF